MTPRRDERGFVLTELLLVMLIGVLLLGSTLLTFERFVSNSKANDRRTETTEAARRALDVEARQLRSLAKRRPDDAAPVIDTVETDQIIFQTSDSTRTWVRYCLDSSDPTDGRLWQQTQAFAVNSPGAPVSAGMRSGCPSASPSWSRTSNVATNVVNRINGRDQPMFSYRCANGGSACAASPAAFDQIIGIDAQLQLDTTPNRGPGEEKVATGVFLRNQNQAPVAQFSTTSITSSSRTVLLNASGSTDYEQRTLTYFWFVGTMPAPASIRCDQPGDEAATTLWGGALAGRGVTLQYTWPGPAPPSGAAQTVGLVACDPGDRHSGVVTQSVTIP